MATATSNGHAGRKRRNRRTPAGYLSPAEYARRLRVDRNRVTEWIKSGRLYAMNIASETSQYDRWIIPLDRVREFEDSLVTCPVKPTPSSRRPAASKEGRPRRYGTTSRV